MNASRWNSVALPRWLRQLLMVSLVATLLPSTCATGQGALPPAADQDAWSGLEFQLRLYRLNEPADDRHPQEILFHPWPSGSGGSGGSGADTYHTFTNLNCAECHVATNEELIDWIRSSHQSGLAVLQQLQSDDDVLGLEVLSTPGRAELIASPRLIVPEGQAATLKIQSDEPLAYFEPRDDGLFELRTMPNASGMELTFTPEPRVEREGQVQVRLSPFVLTLTAIKEREPLSGVDLNVGRPVMETQRLEKEITCLPDQMQAFTFSSATQGRILVVIRMRIHEVGK